MKVLQLCTATTTRNIEVIVIYFEIILSHNMRYCYRTAGHDVSKGEIVFMTLIRAKKLSSVVYRFTMIMTAHRRKEVINCCAYRILFYIKWNQIFIPLNQYCELFIAVIF